MTQCLAKRAELKFEAFFQLLFFCLDMYGYSALHNAVVTQNLKAVRSLTGSTRTCDLEWRDSMGFTALHLATLQGNRDLVEILVLAGCDVNSRTKVSSF